MADDDLFAALRIGLATSDDVRRWSHGEVTTADTINYRTLEPVPGGLFCPTVFGPPQGTCGCPLQRPRFAGIVCGCGQTTAARGETLQGDHIIW